MILDFCSSALWGKLNSLILDLDLTNRLNLLWFTLTRSLAGLKDVKIDGLQIELFLLFWLFNWLSFILLNVSKVIYNFILLFFLSFWLSSYLATRNSKTFLNLALKILLRTFFKVILVDIFNDFFFGHCKLLL